MKLQFLDAWNTGACYTDHGQRIGLWLVLADGAPLVTGTYIAPTDYEALYLVDYDRGIDYIFEPPRTTQGRTQSELAQYGMRSYLGCENLCLRLSRYELTPPERPEKFPLRVSPAC